MKTEIFTGGLEFISKEVKSFLANKKYKMMSLVTVIFDDSDDIISYTATLTYMKS